MDPISIAMLGGGLAGQVIGQFMGQTAQQKMMKAQLAQQRMIAAKDRLDQVRQLRTQTAAVQQAGANSGVGASSGVAGGTASVYGQVGQNIGFLNNQQMYGQVETNDKMDLAKAQGIESISSDIFNIGAKMAQGGVF